MAEPELLYQIGLTLIDGIGDVNAKNLLAYCGNATEVFNQKKEQLQKIPGIGYVLAKSVIKSNFLAFVISAKECLMSPPLKPRYVGSELLT